MGQVRSLYRSAMPFAGTKINPVSAVRLMSGRWVYSALVAEGGYKLPLDTLHAGSLMMASCKDSLLPPEFNASGLNFSNIQTSCVCGSNAYWIS